MDCNSEMQLDHHGRLAKVETEVQSVKNILTLISGLHETLIELTGDYKTTLAILQTQGEAIKANSEAQKALVEKVDNIEALMANKESISRLHDRLEKTNEEVETLKRAPEKKAYDLQQSINRAIVKMAIIFFGGVFGIGILVVYALLQFGFKLTP